MKNLKMSKISTKNILKKIFKTKSPKKVKEKAVKKPAKVKKVVTKKVTITKSIKSKKTSIKKGSKESTD